ncbi:MAG: hypothetical protein OQL08_10745 [Gammaproteobacteria bacterium]|nr:hypothetical protein [Gammaproteobacteria bacterium]
MRGFFVLLAITNLLFFVWQWRSEPQSGEVSPYADTPLYREGLTLISELEEWKMPPVRKFVPAAEGSTLPPLPEPGSVMAEGETEEASSGGASPESALYCYQSSPLETLADAGALQQRLLANGIKTGERIEVQEQKINYWVMLPAGKDETKVGSVVGALKQKQVKDFFVIRSGRYENTISLGVYSTQERAEQRYKEIVALNLRHPKPLIEALELPAKRLAVTFELAQKELPGGLQPLLDPASQPRLRKIPCN